MKKSLLFSIFFPISYFLIAISFSIVGDYTLTKQKISMHLISSGSKLSIFSPPTLLRLLLNLQLKPISSSSPLSSLSSSNIAPPTQENIASLIREQKSTSEALQTFRWASNLPGFKHSHSTYRALTHKLCTFRRFDTVKEVLDEMPTSIGSSPNEDIFVTIIRGLGRAGMIRQVIKVPDMVLRFGGEVSLKIFNSILNVLVKENIDIAREFYRKKMMPSGVEGDDYTFGILMKGLCLTNRISEGFKLLQTMKSRGITPNTVIYNTLLHALCKNGKVGRGRSLMNEMEKPNDVTFNILISGYCAEGNLVQALVLLEKCFNLGFVPDVVTVTKVLQLLCNVGRVKEATEVFERVETKGGTVDVLAYNTLIEGYCKSGNVKVGRFILKDMESKGSLPNADTYNKLIFGYCELGMFDSAVDLFNEMKMDGLNRNFSTYDILIKGLCSGGRVEDGLKILEVMEESKGGSDDQISPYNNIIYGLYKEHRSDEALEFLTNMEKLFPRAVDRSLSIISFCKEGEIDDAKKVYDQMVEGGGIPSVLVFHSLIKGFCQNGFLIEAIELMNCMISEGYSPNASTFNGLIKQFCEQGKVRSALSFIEDIIGRGCLPNTESYSPVVVWLCKEKDLQKALGIVLQMVEKGIIPDYSIWNSLLLCLIQDRVWSENKSSFIVCDLIH